MQNTVLSPEQTSDWFAPRNWRLAGEKCIEVGPEALIMGIVNATPDSFSDGGNLGSVEEAVTAALAMVSEGAHIIDIGGESTRPGADPVTPEKEQERVIPVISELRDRTDALISVDTYRTETARRALLAGANIVNDVWGLQKDDNLAPLIAETGAGCCIMHTGRERQRDRNVISDQLAFLTQSLEIANRAGIADEQIILDPGFGFAKDPDENIELLANLSLLHELGYPLLVGTSRKRFLGSISGREIARDRDDATAATSVAARLSGGAIFRVHDVRRNRDALAVADAIIRAKHYETPLE